MIPRVLKRGFDFLAASAGLLVFAPAIAIVAALVYATMGRPILFAQARPGKNGRLFTLYKFRTMLESRDPADEVLPDGQRLTAIGRFLRRFSLDELPQLWNVLRGDMSFVGPRPLLPDYLPLYSAEQARRHEVRPGLTGWAQINGRNAQTWEERLRLDVWYVDNRSFWLDLKILWLTLLKVARGEGVSQPGHATMPRFTGSPGESHNG
jgi:lipopolysaccharide/colanic/teichoic acid biosynthesis glycosyltransferase